MKFSFVDNAAPSRRRILRDALPLALAASPLASLAKAAAEYFESLKKKNHVVTGQTAATHDTAGQTWALRSAE